MDSWWMDDSSIASYSPEYGESTVVEGLAIGETIINGSWSWDQWDLVDGWSQCVESRGQSTDSQHVNVQRRPHHLKVGNDLLGSMNNCGGVKRILDWIVVDQPGTHPVGNISIIEVPTGSTTDSCGNQPVVYTNNCDASAVNSAGIFEDRLTTGCPGSGSCGFDWEPNKWKWCNGSTQTTLATLNYNVHHNEIKVNGTASSLVDTEILP